MKNITVITISLLIAAPLSGRAADAKQLGQQLRPVSWRQWQGRHENGQNAKCDGSNGCKKQASFTDAKAATAIKDGVKQNGKTTMKAFGGKLSDDEIKALVAYVRTLKK
jgi:Cytochrome c553